MKFGSVIKTIRTARGLSQQEFANRISANTSYISRLEKDNRTPSLKMVRKLADGLEVPYNLLLLLSSDPSSFEGFSDRDINKLSRKLLEVILEDNTYSSRQPKPA